MQRRERIAVSRLMNSIYKKPEYAKAIGLQMSENLTSISKRKAVRSESISRSGDESRESTVQGNM